MQPSTKRKTKLHQTLGIQCRAEQLSYLITTMIAQKHFMTMNTIMIILNVNKISVHRSASAMYILCETMQQVHLSAP